MKPALLAIVGDSAAGKTASADGIMQLLGPDQVATATSTKTPTTISWPAALGPWQVVRHLSGAAAPGLG
jgi:ABC-type dipeptide/oligopeptide/nickel transport system ATPase component